MKKLLCLVLTLALCLSLCGFAGAEADLSEEVTLVFYVMGDAPQDEKLVEDAINEKLLEKFNAKIDFQFSTWTDFQEHYANILRTNGADLIYVANWLDFGKNANAGAFWSWTA
jgi:hypothetical protein